MPPLKSDFNDVISEDKGAVNKNFIGLADSHEKVVLKTQPDEVDLLPLKNRRQIMYGQSR